MKRVLIIGGGFSGTRIAKKLEKIKDYEVTLIDKEEFFEYTPGILRVLVEPEYVKKLQVMHKDYLKRTKIVIGEVSEVGKDFLLLRDSGRKLEFDYLVISSGSNYNSLIKEEGVHYATRVAHLKESYEKLIKSKRVCVIGGGLVGVELAAEICTHFSNKNIMLVHSHDNLINRNSPVSQRYVERFLEKRGVKIIYGERMKEYKNGVMIMDSGKNIKCDVAYLTVGIKSNYDFMKKNYSSAMGKGIKVDSNLLLEGASNIFVCGDVSNIKEEKTAQNADLQGDVVVYNILARDRGSRMKEYGSSKRMMVISLGKWDGLIEYGKFVIGGKIPALVKWGIERWVMSQYR
jgi:apoptosis-inducing factor 2